MCDDDSDNSFEKMHEIMDMAAGIDMMPGLHYRNPRFPLNIKLPDNLECGTQIYVYGKVKSEAEKFTFNLKNAEKDANCYFHLNPRFGEDSNVVVRNSRQDDAWGDEEKDGDNPFAPGDFFLLGVAATVDGYQVEVNGAPFTTFAHRNDMPLCDVTHITMAGDVIVFAVHVPLSSMPIPLTLSIPAKTCVGDMFHLKGEVPDGAEKFALNLQCGSAENADVMFHCNPRFGDGMLVCNNRCADEWDAEERQEGLPLAAGDKFELVVAAGRDAFSTYVNGALLCTFPHRLNMAAACTILVEGDLKIEDFAVDCPWTQLCCKEMVLGDFEENSAHQFYPATPAVLQIPGTFDLGRFVHISGFIHEDATRFHVNLQCGEGEDSDVAIHVNPRFGEDLSTAMVFNNFVDGAWGDEVRCPNLAKAGQRVDVHVVNCERGLIVYLDGDSLIHAYDHVVPYERISHVLVDGDITVTRVFSN